MQTLSQIKELLAARGLSPRKSLGQNFLIDQNLIRKLVDAAGVRGGGPGDLVLEVGPGTGALTDELLARGCAVVACELDHGLADLLRDRHESNPRFTLVEGDCLASKRALAPELLRSLAGRAFTLVANLPYNAASPLMLALLIDHPECRGLFVTVQREVADRLGAAPGTDEYGPLGVVAGALADVRRIAVLPPECFWPRPDVTSAMVAVVRSDPPLTDDPRRLAEFCTRVFSQRRKQIGSVLGRATPWPDGIEPSARAEDLSIRQLIALARVAPSR